jgi:hypothetical protein
MDPLGPSLVLLGLVCPRHLTPKSQLAGNGPGLLDHRGPFLLTLGTNEMPNKMARYIEWQSGGRLTGRAAYAIGKQNLPEPVAGAEWQTDSQFSAADEILRDPSIRDIFQAVIANGVKVVMWR